MDWGTACTCCAAPAGSGTEIQACSGLTETKSKAVKSNEEIKKEKEIVDCE